LIFSKLPPFQERQQAAVPDEFNYLGHPLEQVLFETFAREPVVANDITDLLGSTFTSVNPFKFNLPFTS